MTGFGSASLQKDGLNVSAELKSVNNRFFKLSLKISETFSFLETAVENQLREVISRGTVYANLRISRENEFKEQISARVLKNYYGQLVELSKELGETERPRLDSLIMLPGVVETKPDIDGTENELITEVVAAAVRAAAEKLQQMRLTEGKSLAADISENVNSLKQIIGEVEKIAPTVPEQYRKRLTERISAIMSSQSLKLDERELIREVALFADRCDISEETVRFRSHIAQFEDVIKNDKCCGKKLDFLTQELFRETNTMGAKANDADIIGKVVDMKAVIERIREMIQNVE
jgi:uncharacterized protein (TIGR00255 family)